MQPLGGKPGGRLPGIGAEKAALCGYSIPHAGGVGLGAVDGFGHDLHAHQLPAAVGHGQADGAHAAVEVQQRVIRGQLRVLRGNAVKPLGGSGVDLIEGQRPQLHRYAAQGVLNKARAVQGTGLGTEDDVGVLAVDIEQDGGDVPELPGQPGAQLFGVGELRAGADQTHHDLPAVVAPPQEDMPHQPPAVVGLDALFGKEGAQRIADVVQYAGLQAAVRAGDDAVGAACVETDAGMPVFVQTHRELHLVAVAVGFRRGQDGQHRHLQSADARKGIGHILLLGAQLGFVAQVAQAAAAAGAGHSAVHRDAVGRGGEHLVQNTESVALAVLDDAHPGFVAGGSAGNEHGLAVRAVGHTAAVAGQPLDAQGEELVLL